MAVTEPSNQLSDKLPVTLVLRMVLDAQGRLEHGELVNVSGKMEGRFNNRDSLLHALDAWLARQQNG